MFDKSARFYDLIYSFKDYAEESRRLDQIIRSRTPDARTVLDVACGTGAHIKYIARRYEVEGVDINDELLEIGRKRNPGTQFQSGDMRSFDLGKQFDAVLCLFSSIGYMTTREDLRTAVSNMTGHVDLGGVLIVEPWFAPDEFEDGRVELLTWEESDLKIARASYSQLDGGISRIHLAYLVAERGAGVAHFSERHDLGLYEAEEYIAALEAAGLGDIQHDREGLMGRGLFIGSKRGRNG